MPWRRATNCAIPPLAGSILLRWAQDDKSADSDADHTRIGGSLLEPDRRQWQGPGRTRTLPCVSSDHRPHMVEVPRDFAFALLSDPLIPSEPAKLCIATILCDLLAVLGGDSWTAGPLDQLEPGAQCHTPWICEWKCRRQNDSLMFSGRGNAQMAVRRNVRNQ